MEAPAKAHLSIPSLIALGAAIGSLCTGGFSGFLLAIVAIVFGVIGFLLAMSPTVRGGLVSALSLGLACLGILLAVIRAIRWAL